MTAHTETKNATLNIRIEPKLLKQLRAEAKKQGLPHAELVRLLIRNEVRRIAKFERGHI